jgi:hypothetical protein
MEHKTIKLWTSTRATGNILSGNEKLNHKIVKKINELSGIKITQTDINSFPKILKMFPLYLDTIYRGVFTDDELYKQILVDNNATTNRYYSFSKSFDIAKRFGKGIILRINSCVNFDISKYSKESEVILDKCSRLSLSSVENKGEFTIMNLRIV